MRVTDKGLHLFTPHGVEEWPNPEPLHRPLNRAFMAAVRSGDAAYIRTPLRTGLLSTAVALAGNRSAACGQAVNVAQFLAEEAGLASPASAEPVSGRPGGVV